MPRPPPALALVATLLVAAILLAHPYIDLALARSLPLPGGRTWHADAPVADLAALALLPLALAAALRSPAAARPPLPGTLGWLLLLGASALSVAHAMDPGAAVHHLVRKPLLAWLLYGVGMSWAAALLVRRRPLEALAALSLLLLTAISLLTSVQRIALGDALWFQPLAGLTPNHKTLAICLAGWMPLVLGAALDPVRPGRERKLAATLGGLAGLAILASASKTAWLGTGLGLGLLLPRDRPLAWRPRLLVPLVILGLALAYYAPILVHSRTMLDAARARHSLDLRAWRMFAAHPLSGSGTGMSTVYEMVDFPHYRINGVDAHGALQKVAGETGLLGLGGLVLFTVQVGRSLLARWGEERRARPALPPTRLLSWASFSTFVVLMSLLLLSTELFTPTHWVPLATAWVLARPGRLGPRSTQEAV